MTKLKSKEYAGTDNLMNPERPYVPAAKTDVAETFRRIREKIEAEQREAHVFQMQRKRK